MGWSRQYTITLYPTLTAHGCKCWNCSPEKDCPSGPSPSSGRIRGHQRSSSLNVRYTKGMAEDVGGKTSLTHSVYLTMVSLGGNRAKQFNLSSSCRTAKSKAMARSNRINMLAHCKRGKSMVAGQHQRALGSTRELETCAC